MGVLTVTNPKLGVKWLSARIDADTFAAFDGYVEARG